MCVNKGETTLYTHPPHPLLLNRELPDFVETRERVERLEREA